VQDAQTNVVLAASQIAKSAFFMFFLLKTSLGAMPSIAKFLQRERLSIGKLQPYLCQEFLRAHFVILPTGLIALLSSGHCKVD
jgi:hypothetical protein